MTSRKRWKMQSSTNSAPLCAEKSLRYVAYDTTQHTEKRELLVKVTATVTQFAQDLAVNANKNTKDFLKSLMDTTGNKVLDSPALTKISNAICGKLFCAGPDAEVSAIVFSCLPRCLLCYNDVRFTYTCCDVEQSGSLVRMKDRTRKDVRCHTHTHTHTHTQTHTTCMYVYTSIHACISMI
jgi:hypothetical protein